MIKTIKIFNVHHLSDIQFAGRPKIYNVELRWNGSMEENVVKDKSFQCSSDIIMLPEL